MNNYKDFNYVQYILNADIEISYRLFLSMRDREYNNLEQKSKDRAFQMFLKENPEGLNFNDYYENMKKQAENSKMPIGAKDAEEKRILEKYSNINDLKRKEF